MSFARRRPAHSPALEALEGSRSGQARVWRGRSSTAAEPEHRRSTTTTAAPAHAPNPAVPDCHMRLERRGHSMHRSLLLVREGGPGGGLRTVQLTLSRRLVRSHTLVQTQMHTILLCLSLSLSLSVSLSVSTDPHEPRVFSVFL